MSLAIEFLGNRIPVDREPFTIGRIGDLVIDDNQFLHRTFLVLSRQQGVWMLANRGDLLTATASDSGGRLEAFLAPGAVLPVVLDETSVRFTAGPTTYEFTLRLDERPIPSAAAANAYGETTIGKVSLTRDQRLLILALAEPALRGNGRSGTALPSSNQAARRLGWTSTKFTRKLDNVCQKLTAASVRGLHGGPGHLASNRRARLVEYALAVRLVSRNDLAELDAVHAEWPDGSP